MTVPEPVALSWEVNGLSLAGLSWGTPGRPPLLALHGWLDNAASFSILAPLLEQHHVVAVDLTGHGRSASRSADAGYQIWDDLPELLGVLDALAWDRFSVIGHSRGAIISTLLASAIPERVERLVLLDGLAPAPVPEEAFSTQLRRFLDEKRYWRQRENRRYASIDSAISSRTDTSLPNAAAKLLVERNLRPVEGGYTWTTDLRLRGASAVKLTAAQVESVLRALSMPTLLLLADQGFGRNPEMCALARKTITSVDIAVVPGGHHFHMEPGAAIVAQRISGFLLGHDNQEHDDK